MEHPDSIEHFTQHPKFAQNTSSTQHLNSVQHATFCLALSTLSSVAKTLTKCLGWTLLKLWDMDLLKVTEDTQKPAGRG